MLKEEDKVESEVKSLSQIRIEKDLDVNTKNVDFEEQQRQN